MSGEVAILHQDDRGVELILRAQLLDGSKNGARFRTERELPLRSPVVFYHRKLMVGGRGTVRYCNWSSAGFEIGIEFCHPVNWRGPSVTEALGRLRSAVTEDQVAQHSSVPSEQAARTSLRPE